MPSDHTMKANDRLPSFQVHLFRGGELVDGVLTGGAPVDLSTALDVWFIMRATAGDLVKVNSLAVIVDPAAVEGDEDFGAVRYDWQAVDTDLPGDFRAEWEVHWPGSGPGDVLPETFPTLGYSTVHIEPDLDQAP